MQGFEQLRLVGGTSLALQIGHRISVDIDLFGELLTDYIGISNNLSHLGNAQVLRKSTNIFSYLLENIKVDIVNYPYPWLAQPVIADGLILADIKDIGAMKLAAITGRGTKKDFIDLFFILRRYTLQELLSFYVSKYHDGSEFLVLKSLTYFEDADQEESLNMLAEVDWIQVKYFIADQVKNYLNGNT